VLVVPELPDHATALVEDHVREVPHDLRPVEGRVVLKLGGRSQVHEGLDPDVPEEGVEVGRRRVRDSADPIHAAGLDGGMMDGRQIASVLDLLEW